jgi:hypothetical protein
VLDWCLQVCQSISTSVIFWGTTEVTTEIDKDVPILTLIDTKVATTIVQEDITIHLRAIKGKVTDLLAVNCVTVAHTAKAGIETLSWFNDQRSGRTGSTSLGAPDNVCPVSHWARRSSYFSLRTVLP